MIRRTLIVLTGLLALAGTACSTAASAPQTAQTLTTTAPSSKLAVILLENRDRARAEKEMTYLPALERQYAGATSYHSCADPSLPNYLCLGFGNDFNITDDRNAKIHQLHGQTVFGNALANGNTAHEFAESEQTPCSLINEGTDAYVVHHNAWPYAIDERSLCRANMTGFEPLADAEANGMPTLSWIVPNNQHNGHRPSNDVIADNYLKNTLLPPLMASPEFQDGTLTIVVTFDEGRDLTFAGGTVMFVVLNAALDGAHLQVTDTIDHYDMWRSQLRYGGSLISGTDALALFGL